jgi:hypothetical protein
MSEIRYGSKRGKVGERKTKLAPMGMPTEHKRPVKVMNDSFSVWIMGE